MILRGVEALPMGLTLPLLVALPLSRGLSLAQVGGLLGLGLTVATVEVRALAAVRRHRRVLALAAAVLVCFDGRPDTARG